MVKKYSFEDKIDIINNELAKRRGKWQLSSLSYMDFDDVCQIIKLHIYIKWKQWDQERPLVNWLNRLITNRLINLSRDNYGSLAPPCKDCPFSLWGEHCEYTPSGLKSPECKLYAHWEKSKKSGYNLKLASSIDSDEYIEKESGSVSFSDSKNVEDHIPDFHKSMAIILNETQLKVYNAFFVENHPDEKLAEMFGKDILNNKSKLYKRIGGIKREIVNIAKKEATKIDFIE